MRPFERVTVEVKPKAEGSHDFGNKTVQWEPVCENVHVTIEEKSARLIQSGNQMVPLYDEMLTIHYQPEIQRLWQDNRVLRVVDSYGDTYGVESVKHVRNVRPHKLKLRCIRGRSG